MSTALQPSRIPTHINQKVKTSPLLVGCFFSPTGSPIVVTRVNPSPESDSSRRTRCFFRWTLRHLADGASSHSSIMVTLDPPVSNLHFQRLDIFPTDRMLGGDTKLSHRLRLPWSPPRLTPEAVSKCEADGCAAKRRRWRANGATRSGRGWRRGVDVKLVGGLKEWGGNVSVWLKREIDADGRSCGGWVLEEFLIFVTLSDYQWGRIRNKKMQWYTRTHLRTLDGECTKQCAKLYRVAHWKTQIK